MIITVTLNAALDVTYRVPALVSHATHRVLDAVERPGGKGLNVARVLAAFGQPVTVTGFAGGPAGDEVRRRLAAGPHAERLTDALVPIAGQTRRTVTVVDAGSGGATVFNEPGPTVSPGEWAALLGVYRELLAAGADAVALCGSLPPGVPVGAYAELIREARAAGVYVLLDAGGPALQRGLAARPDLIKPNADELAGLTGFAEPVRAARDARRRGARAVAASLGADGMVVLAEEDGGWRAAPPLRLTGNPTGAGDSAVAGLLSGVAEGLPWPDRLARAVALSAAAVLAPAAGEYDPAVYDELLPRVEVVPATS